MDGIRTGKCIEMADNRIFQITGTFVNNTLQVRTTKKFELFAYNRKNFREQNNIA